jgi:hypothetical protein
MTLKSRSPIAFYPGAKLKKMRGGFSMNKGPIAKSQNFRGTIKIRHIS